MGLSGQMGWAGLSQGQGSSFGMAIVSVHCWGSPGDLPNPGIKLGPPALQADSLPPERSGKLSIKELLDKGETNLEQKKR